MSLASWLAIVAAVIIAAFVAVFAVPGTTTAPTIAPQTSGFASLGTVTNVALPALPLPNLVAGAASSSATTSKSVVPAPHPVAPATVAPAASVASPTAAPSAAASTSSAIAPAASATTVSTSAGALNSTVGLVQGALVNIICVPHSPNLKAASASGVVIDSRGIIMTVAHMAQYFLLADYPAHGDTQCIIRTGSPAQNAYTAQLIYISPEWIKANPTTLVESVPIGTGEDDFAFLAITGSATDAPLPSSFTSIALSPVDATLNEAVTIGSYGAEFLDAQQIESSLYPIVVFGTVTDRFTFAKTTPDLIAVTNTAAAQEGSSGGIMVDGDDQISGLITTSSLSSGSVTSRTLHAITPNYIRRAFLADTGESLDSYLAGSTLSALVQKFIAEKNDLASLLESNLN